MAEHSRKPRCDERVFKIKALQRDYTYRVFVTIRGGSVRRVTAGCRYWQTFGDAFRHYRGETVKPEWSDESLSAMENVRPMNAWRSIAHRAEARAILGALEKMVRKYQQRRARARRR